jgi:hypothetical protein
LETAVQKGGAGTQLVVDKSCLYRGELN